MEFVDNLQENAYILQQLAKKENISEILQNKARKRVLERRRVKRVQDEVRAWLAANATVLSIVDVPDTARNVFRLASVMCLNGPIMAPDAVHLAIALLLGCDIVLTQDELFLKSVNEHLAKKGSAFRRLTFDHIAEITGAPIGQDELNAEGLIIKAHNVDSFLNRFPPP
jgi:predicted nucleic acid-binding protein